MLFIRNNKKISQEQLNYLLKDISTAVLETEVLRLRQQLDNIHREQFKKETKTIPFKPSSKYAAASIVLIIISSVVVINSKKIDRKELYKSNYKTYSATYKVRSVEVPTNTNDNAIYFYKKKDFEKSAVLFKEITLNSPKKIGAYFYLGISYMENKQFDLAIETLQHIIATNNYYFSEQAEWYLSLCYIITKKDSQALDLLKKIADNESFYSNKASVLVKQINKLKN